MTRYRICITLSPNGRFTDNILGLLSSRLHFHKMDIEDEESGSIVVRYDSADIRPPQMKLICLELATTMPEIAYFDIKYLYENDMIPDRARCSADGVIEYTGHICYIED